jgi:3-hydroxyisobutyrate dehydrogenase-like beta-hydroxyacid dehydrogenase
MSTKQSLAIAGLGLMGGAIAANLVDAGHSVCGFDPQPAAAERARGRGVEVVSSLDDLPHGADIVLTSLPSAAALDDAVRALEQCNGRVSVVVELSTLPIADKESARQRLAGRGIAMLDAPISGTGAQAVRRDLSVYGSGDEAAWKRVETIVAAFAVRARYVGAFGNGMRLKCIANLLVAIHNVATAEALVLAEAAGMDLTSVVELIREGAGNSRIFELRGPLMATGEYLPATMKLDVWQKDMALIDAFAREHGARTPLFDATQPIYTAARDARPQADTAAVFEAMRCGAPAASAG